MKHRFSLFIPLFLLLVLVFPMNARAGESGSCGEDVTWSLNAAKTTITISGSGRMDDYTDATQSPWYQYCDTITTVVVDPGVTYIGDNAFAFTFVRNAYFRTNSQGEGLLGIGNYAFAYSSLTSVQLPGSLVYIGDGAFSYCSLVEFISLPSFYRISDSAFYNCTNLKSVTIPEGVQFIGSYAFAGCDSLTSVSLPSSLLQIDPFAFAYSPIASATYSGSKFQWISQVAVATLDEHKPLLNTLSFTKGGDPGWVLDADGEWHLYQNGSLYTGWKQVDSKWYYLDENGSLVRGEIVDDGDYHYYLGRDGAWVTTSGIHFYEKLHNAGAFERDCYLLIDQNGHVCMTKGWHNVKGYWYYVTSLGTLLMDGIVEGDGAYMMGEYGIWVSTPGLYSQGWSTDYFRGLYYVGSDGRLESGWHKVNGDWYYMSKVEYCAYVGFWVIDGHMYYFNEEGIMQTGKQWITTSEYDANVGGYVDITRCCDFGTNGAMALSPGWQEFDGWTYYVKSDGTFQSGWMKQDGKWYYFDKVSYTLYDYDDNFFIDGELYYFDKNGVMVTDAWRLCSWYDSNGNWHTSSCYFGSNGAAIKGWKQTSGSWYYIKDDYEMAYGWQNIGGSWYYFDENGVMQSGWKNIDGRWYYLGNAMATGWKQVSGTWYYFGSNGAMRTGWQEIANTWYYFGTDGGMKTGWKQIDGYWYYFGSDGAMKSGWQKIDGIWYYLDYAMTTGWKQIGGTWYYFKSSGAMASGETLTIGGKNYSFAANGAWIS